jgi:hypothetical protein
MAEAVIQPEASTAPLNEIQRIVDTFVAPTKTFDDIRRSAMWWGPLVIMILVSVAFTMTVTKKVGWPTVYENNLRLIPKMKAMVDQQMATMTPEQQAVLRAKGAHQQEVNSYVHPVGVLVIIAIAALLVWPTLNFGFGGTAKYSRVFAVFMYTALISDSCKYILGIVALYAGLVPDSFAINNPVGTNLGYYLSGGDSPLWLVSLGSAVDILGIWALVLSVIGCSIVAKVKRGQAAIAVIGWWALFILAITGIAAVFA